MVRQRQWLEYETVKSSSSNREYKISQKVTNGRPTRTYGCSCPGWKNYGDCKHLKQRNLATCRGNADMPESIPADIRRERIMARVGDIAASFLYYDRKEDEELPCGQIEDAIADGEITVGEIVKKFREDIETAIE